MAMIASVPVVLALLLSPPAGKAPPRINPGLWKTTVQIRFLSYPAPERPFVTSRCLTRQDPVPDVSQAGQQCQVTRLKTSRANVEWSLTCQDAIGTTLEGSGKIVVHPTRFSGTMSMVMSSAGMPTPMHYKLTGKRVGPCPPRPPPKLTDPQSPRAAR